MLELNLLMKRPQWLLNINFEDSAVGSKAIYDSALSRNLTRKVITAGGVDGVVNHASFGKCYRFDAKSYFDTVGTIALNANSYQIDVAFAGDNVAGHQLFGTGGYPASGPYSGSVFGLGQYPERYIQYFQVEEVSKAFARVWVDGYWAANRLELVRITKTPQKTKITNFTTGVTNEYTTFNTAKDTYFILGAGVNSTGVYAAYSGYLKYLRIKKL